MADRRTVDELSLAELEHVLLTRRRLERMQRLRERGIERELPEPVAPAPDANVARLPEFSPRPRHLVAGKAPPSFRARLLTVVEVLALVGFLAVVGLWYWQTRQTNLVESSEPLVLSEEGRAPEAAAILPGNPEAPADETPIPPLYQAWIQPSNRAAAVPLGEQSDQRPTRIVIPRINVDAPVVQGDDWEALKRGAGHHPGSALPGERGNMVISAHNDIFGEIFRYLEELEPGDEFSVFDASNREYRYVVRTRRIVEPTEVSVLDSSPEPLATLITCHPYMIDSQRLVIQAELQQ